MKWHFFNYRAQHRRCGGSIVSPTGKSPLLGYGFCHNPFENPLYESPSRAVQPPCRIDPVKRPFGRRSSFSNSVQRSDDTGRLFVSRLPMMSELPILRLLSMRFLVEKRRLHTFRACTAKTGIIVVFLMAAFRASVMARLQHPHLLLIACLRASILTVHLILLNP